MRDEIRLTKISSDNVAEDNYVVYRFSIYDLTIKFRIRNLQFGFFWVPASTLLLFLSPFFVTLPRRMTLYVVN